MRDLRSAWIGTAIRLLLAAASGSPAMINPALAESRGFLIGVGTKFAHDPIPETRKALAQTGATAVREDMNWARFPRYDQFQPLPRADVASVTGLVAARRSGLQPLVILAYGHDGVDDGKRPTSPGGIAAFTNYAANIARITGPAKPMFEIWNEWNLHGGGDNSPASAHAYARLASATIDRLKVTGGGRATVLVGAPARDPDWKWSARVAASGILRRASGYSVHVYNYWCDQHGFGRSPGELLQRLDGLQRVLSGASGLAVVPIYVTEVGWPTLGKCAVDPAQAAGFLGQTMLSFPQRPWIKGMWVYELRDRSFDAADKEANFGLFKADFAPKPSACVFRQMAGFLRDARPAGLGRLPNGVTVSRFFSGDGPVIAVWATVSGQQPSIRLDGTGPIRLQRLCIGAQDLASGTRLRVGDQPMLIRGKIVVRPA